MATKSPLKTVEKDFGTKEKLVDKVADLLEKGEESKDELKARLLGASNSKLLKLFTFANEMKKQFNGSREKLVEAILTKLNRAKDADYKGKLLKYTPGRLLDMYKSIERKAKPAAAKSKKSA